MIRHAGRAVVHTLAGVLGATLVALALVLWRLGGGPITLSMLSPNLAEALSGEAVGYAIAFDDTVLVLGEWPRALDIRLTRVRIVDDAGNMLLVAPEVGVGLSLGDLLVGAVTPVSLDAVRPLLRVVRDAQGNVSIGGGEQAAADPAAGAGWESILADLGPRPDPRRPLAKLDLIAISDGTVVFEDQGVGVAWRAEALDLTIERVEQGVAVEAAARLPFGDPTAHVDLSLVAERDRPEVAVTARFGGLRPARLAGLAPELASLAGVELAFGAVVEARLGAEARLLDARIEAWSGPGTVDPGGVFGTPRAVKGFNLRAHLPPGLRTVVVDAFELDVGAGELNGTARIAGLDGTGTLDLDATVKDIAIADVLDFWPPELGVGARSWLAANLPAAMARSGTIGLVADIAALGVDESPLHGLTLALDVADATVVYKAPLAPAEGVSGRVVIADYALDVDSLKGTASGLAVSAGRVVMPSLDGTQGLTVTLDVAGPLGAALALAADPSLDLGGVADLAARGATADARGTVAVALPRLNDLARDDVDIAIDASLERVAMAEAAPGLAITDGALDLTIEGAAARAAGAIVLAGVPLDLTLAADMASGGLRATLAGRLDARARAALGLDLGDWFSGTIDAGLVIEDAAEATRFEAGADLTGALIDVPDAGWTKPAGEPGDASARWTMTADGAATIDTIAVTAGGLAFDGAAAFGADGAWRVEARRLVLGGNDVTGTLARGADGYAIALDARSIDLAPYMESLTGEAADEDEPLPPFRLSGSIGSLALRPGQALTGVAIEVDFADDHFRGLAFSGTMPGGAPMVLSIVPAGAGRTFSLDAGDAGDALRLFDVFDDARGGRLEISAAIDDAQPDRPATGRLVMTDFKVRDAPILGQILAAGSFTAIGALLNGEGIPFSKANVPFVKRGGLVTIGKAHALGGSIGLNGEGTIDIGADVIDLRGTLVPAYRINSILGSVPILGELLVGGEGEGLFAATYAVKGPLGDPDVLVNPLATLAPGFLREIFEFEEGQVVPAPPPSDTGQQSKD